MLAVLCEIDGAIALHACMRRSAECGWTRSERPSRNIPDVDIESWYRLISTIDAIFLYAELKHLKVYVQEITVLKQGSTLTFFSGPIGPLKSLKLNFWWPDIEIWWPEENKAKHIKIVNLLLHDILSEKQAI